LSKAKGMHYAHAWRICDCDFALVYLLGSSITDCALAIWCACETICSSVDT